MRTRGGAGGGAAAGATGGPGHRIAWQGASCAAAAVAKVFDCLFPLSVREFLADLPTSGLRLTTAVSWETPWTGNLSGCELVVCSGVL
jgi:hypothetical protein